VAAYFDPDEMFAGLTFTGLGSNPRDRVTGDDLLAVSLLDIAWRPDVVRQLRGPGAAAGHICGLLAAIRSDVDLWEASDEDLATVDPLWDVLLRMPGVDVAIWIRHSHSPAAIHMRRDTGIPEPQHGRP